MASINFNGLGSGIDFSKLVEAAVADRMRPITQLQTKATSLGQRSEALRALNAALVNLTSAASALTDRTLGQGRAANSTDYSIVAPTATSAATVGTINLQVIRLATGFTQASRSFSSPSAPVLPEGTESATFELRKGGASTGIPLTLDASNNSLAGLRDAINGADAGLTASIISLTGSGDHQLVLTSKETGAANRIELVETSAPETDTLGNLNLRRLNAPGDPADLSTLDAQLSINGLTLTRPTNQVQDALAGVTLSLQKTGAATVSIQASTEIQDKLQAFVSAYNAAQDFILNQYRKDSRGRPTGLLAGDPTLRAVQQQLRDALGALSATNGGSLSSLAELGLGRDNDGKLTLDRTLLGDRIKTSFADAQALLSGKTANETGLAHSIHSTLKSLSENITGMVPVAIDNNQTSIANLNRTIADQMERVNALGVTLQKQFAAVDAAIGQLNGQGTALTSILKSLEPRAK